MRESLASVWDGLWFAYISALRSGSRARIEAAREEMDAFNAELAK
jgi:hypothetical protein